MRDATPIINAFTAGELSRHLDGRTDHEKYFSGCRRLENFVVRPHGSVFRRPGTRFIREAKDSSQAARLIPFDFNAQASQSYVIEMGGGYLRFFRDGGVIVTGSDEPYEIETPYAASEVFGVRFVQSSDTLYLVHANHQPRTLTRAGHTDWTLAAMQFKIPGHDLSLADGNGDGKANGLAGDTLTLPDQGSFSASCVVNGQDLSGAARLFCYRGQGVFAADGQDLALTFLDSPEHADNEIETIYSGGALRTQYWEIALSDSSCPADWGEGNWPSAAAFYEDRLVLGAAPMQPLTLWFSRTGGYEDFRINTCSFEDGVQGEPLADDAFDVTLSGARVNPIRWVMDQEDLLVGTNASEVRVWSGSEGKAMTPSDRQCKRQSANGSADRPALPAGGAVLFVSRSGRRIREMRFDIGTYRYTAPDLTLLAEHVTSPGVADLDYAREPHGILWVARADGVLAGCTYLREESVVAWHRHPLGGNGAAEAVACIPGDQGDEVWLLVRREVNKTTRRYIERLDPDFQAAGGLDEAFFVDCGLSYHGQADSEVTGLDHLEGETVAVLADGRVKTPRLVSNGTILLDAPASAVHAGLAYASVLQPMRLEVGASSGTSQTKKKRVMAVTARFMDTVGGRVCPGDDVAGKYESIVPSRSATASGLAPALFSGDAPVRLSGGFERDGLFTIRQDDPLPMTVICVVPEVQVAE